MTHITFTRRLVHLALALALICALIPAASQTGYGPPFESAVAVDAHSVLVSWGVSPLAESYRIHRVHPYADIEVPAEVNEYLDTGLTTGEVYTYHVHAVVNGYPYPCNGLTPQAVPMDAPEAITTLAWERASGDDLVHHLAIGISWMPVPDAVKYDVFGGVMGSEYGLLEQTAETACVVRLPLPQRAAQYWFKVRARMEVTFYESGEVVDYPGPFCPAVSIDVPALTPIPPPNMELTRKATYRLSTITPRPTFASTIAPPSRRATYRLATVTPHPTETLIPGPRIYTPTPAPSRSIRRPEPVDITAAPAPALTVPAIKMIPFKRP